MTDYTKLTDFAAKDSLLSGNPAKVVRGSEIDAEFTNIAVAVATKTDEASAAITGGTIDGTSVGATNPSTGAFTTLSATGNTTLGDASTDTVTVNGYMGVGGAGAANRGLTVASTALTSSDQVGASFLPVATSAATSSVNGVIAQAGTAAAAFTATNLYQFRAYDAVKGAGSTITNLHGVYVADQTQGTNNYGITSLVSSGTNKWNIYASGTAANYFAGQSLIGTATAISSEQVQIQKTAAGSVANNLRLTNTGTTVGSGSGVLFGAYTNGGVYTDLAGVLVGSSGATSGYLALGTNNAGTYAERLRIDSAGNVGIGTTAPAATNNVTIGDGAIANNASIYLNGGSNSAKGVGLKFAKAGTAVGFIGSASWLEGGTSDALAFSANSGATVGMRLDSAGNLGLGGVTPSAWDAGFKVAEVSPNGYLSLALATDINSSYILNNAAYTGGGWKYKNTKYAVRYDQDAATGVHKWYTAPSGTAGNAITFTQSLAVGNGTTLALEGATSAAGTGIAFPATQLASSNANTLDDYEEGTWTPSVGGTATYTFQAGWYTKVGRAVHAYCKLTINAIGTGSVNQISGLPFANNGTVIGSAHVGYYSAAAGSFVFVTGYLPVSASTINIVANTAAAATITASPTFFGSGTEVEISTTYFV